MTHAGQASGQRVAQSLRKTWACTNHGISLLALVVPGGLLVCPHTHNRDRSWCMSEVFCNFKGAATSYSCINQQDLKWVSTWWLEPAEHRQLLRNSRSLSCLMAGDLLLHTRARQALKRSFQPQKAPRHREKDIQPQHDCSGLCHKTFMMSVNCC